MRTSAEPVNFDVNIEVHGKPLIVLLDGKQGTREFCVTSI
jgi:hypothetical protein